MGLFVVITENISPASSTVLTIGPIVSKLLHSGTTPSIDTLPKVVLNQLNHSSCGILTDPPVSEPIAAGARPKATDAAAPDEEPPATALDHLHKEASGNRFKPKQRMPTPTYVFS